MLFGLPKQDDIKDLNYGKYILSQLEGVVFLVSVGNLAGLYFLSGHKLLLLFFAGIIVLVSMDFGLTLEVFLSLSEENVFAYFVMPRLIAGILFSLKSWNALQAVSQREQAISQWMVESKDYLRELAYSDTDISGLILGTIGC